MNINGLRKLLLSKCRSEKAWELILRFFLSTLNVSSSLKDDEIVYACEFSNFPYVML